MNKFGEFSKGDLCFTLCRFVREVKKMNGDDYPPNTIHELVVMLQMHLNEKGVFWKLYDNVEFSTLRNVIDNTKIKE